MGPEWWYGRNPDMQVTYLLIDSINRCTAASMTAALAMGAKGSKVAKVVQDTPEFPRPWAPPKPKPTFAEKANRLVSALLGR